jgi:hypothetical protein
MHLIFGLALSQIYNFTVIFFNHQIENLADFVNIYQLWVWHLTLIIFMLC